MKAQRLGWLRATTAAAIAAIGCARPPSVPTVVANPPDVSSASLVYSSPRYAKTSMWLCRPESRDDVCHGDQRATELRPDGRRVARRHEAARSPSVDCFYVYPTVDLRLRPENHEDFDDTSPMEAAASAQIARFGEACRVFAPLYRQVTIGSYLRDRATLERYFETAFSDVADAFLHYLAHDNGGRPIVLVGHSQGAEMVLRLLQRYFDASPAMRARLALAMPIGGDLEVPIGALAGGSLQNIPLCSHAGEKGCVIAFRTHRAGPPVAGGRSAPKPGFQSACVNPADVGGSSPALLARSYLPTSMRDLYALWGADDVTTPFTLYRKTFRARCVDGLGGYRYLEIEWAPSAGDVREAPLDLDDDLWGTELGLHLLDMQLTQGDLIDLVQRAAPRH